jgi:hypothetical protein
MVGESDVIAEWRLPHPSSQDDGPQPQHVENHPVSVAGRGKLAAVTRGPRDGFNRKRRGSFRATSCAR